MLIEIIIRENEECKYIIEYYQVRDIALNFQGLVRFFIYKKEVQKMNYINENVKVKKFAKEVIKKITE